jgi:hypothetical protein
MEKRKILPSPAIGPWLLNICRSGGIAPPYLMLAMEGGEWLASLPGHFTPWEEAPGTHWTEGSVNPRACLGSLEKRNVPSHY